MFGQRLVSLLTPALLLLHHLLPCALSQSQSALTLSCPSPSNTTTSTTTTSTATIPFETFLNSLLLTLDSAGFTSFESFLAGVATAGGSQTDDGDADGYEEGDDTGLVLLEGMWDAVVNGGEEWVLLVPSDQAFSVTSLPTPYTSLPISTSYPILAYHILPSSLLLSTTLPTSPSHVSFDTVLPVDEQETDAIGSSDGSGSEGGEGSPLIAQRGSGDEVVFRLTKGNATTTDGLTAVVLGDGVPSGGLGGLTLIAIDGVLTPPSSLADTLTTLSTATTSATSSGLSLYAAALSNTSTLSVLEGLLTSNTSTSTSKRSTGSDLENRATSTGNGLTIFAPVDAAFSDQLTSGSVTAWAKVLNGHYSTAQTLLSTNFSSATPSSPITLYMSTGSALSVFTNSTGTFVLAGDGSGSVGKVLRSDVVLEGGGVLHVIDTLLSSSTLRTSSASASSSTSGGVRSLDSSSFTALVGSSLFVGTCVIAILGLEWV